MAMLCLLVGVLICLGYVDLNWFLNYFDIASYLGEMLSKRRKSFSLSSIQSTSCEMMQRCCQGRPNFA